jgi:hypothetical protein
MSAMRPSVLLWLLAVAALPGPAPAQPSMPWSATSPSSTRLSLLVRASLARARIGYADAELDQLRAGIGIGWGKFGIIASTGWSHIAPSGWAGDYMFEVTGWPVECDLTYGLVPGNRLGSPVLYVHGEYALASGPGILDQHGGNVGVGALWTYWAISGGVQITWRRSVSGNAAPWDRYHDFYSIGVVVDLGGWWPIRLGKHEEDSWDGNL